MNINLDFGTDREETIMFLSIINKFLCNILL